MARRPPAPRRQESEVDRSSRRTSRDAFQPTNPITPNAMTDAAYIHALAEVQSNTSSPVTGCVDPANIARAIS